MLTHLKHRHSLPQGESHTAGTGGPGRTWQVPGRLWGPHPEAVAVAPPGPSRREWALSSSAGRVPGVGEKGGVQTGGRYPESSSWETLGLRGGTRTLRPQGRGPGPGPQDRVMVQDSTPVPTVKQPLPRLLPFGASVRGKWGAGRTQAFHPPPGLLAPGGGLVDTP